MPVNSSTDRFTGRITVHPAGYGFVTLDRESGGETVFIPAKYRGAAMDGDRVELTTWRSSKGWEGEVEHVLARGRAKLTGILRKIGKTIVLEPDDPRIATDYGFVTLVGKKKNGSSGNSSDGNRTLRKEGTPERPDDDTTDAADELGERPARAVGKAAVVAIRRYPTTARPELSGRLIRILGEPGDPRVEIEKILCAADVPGEFSAAAVARAETTAKEVTPADLGRLTAMTPTTMTGATEPPSPRADRVDLRHLPFVTIDPEDARDFDDALCIEDGPGGTARVWVAVADVSHYVQAGDAIDREARARGVSVYLPDRVVPMLPEALSNGICSLAPDIDRLAMVVRLDIGKDGQIRDTAFMAAVICSHGRLDYPGVAAALAGDFTGPRARYRRFASSLGALDKVAQTLREKRRARGALLLDIAEAKVLLDHDDARLVRDIVRTRGPLAQHEGNVARAYELVEEFMIAANEAVGEFFAERDLPVIWRIHAPPERSRLEELASMLASYGIELDIDKAITPRGLEEAIDRLADRPQSRALSFLILRSLKQASYDLRPVGHFGLASPRYLHFTSPIRRYPDLVVHRLLKAALLREGWPAGAEESASVADETALSDMASSSSQAERRALEAEREAVSMYRAYFMRDRVGDELTGRVSAVTGFGVFVEIDEPFVEGLIKLDDLGSDSFVYDDKTMRLCGRRTGLELGLGDRVQVEILDVSVLLRRIDLRLTGKIAAEA